MTEKQTPPSQSEHTNSSAQARRESPNELKDSVDRARAFVGITSAESTSSFHDDIEQAIEIANSGKAQQRPIVTYEDRSPQTRTSRGAKELEPRKSTEVSRAKKLAAKTTVGLIGAGLALGGGIHLVDEATSPTEVSEKTTTITAEEEDTLYRIALKHVKGSEDGDLRDIVDAIKSYPENQDALADGYVNPGEQFVIPWSTKDYEKSHQEDVSQ